MEHACLPFARKLKLLVIGGNNFVSEVDVLGGVTKSLAAPRYDTLN
jgi:hypothetical protein